jgi:histone H3/H4
MAPKASKVAAAGQSGKVSAKRKRDAKTKAVNDLLLGITRPGLRRLAYRAGIKRIEEDAYKDIRDIILSFLVPILTRAVLLSDHSKRKTV